MKATLPDKLESGRLRSGRMGSDSRYGPNGMFRIQGPCGIELCIMASTGDAEFRWEHVSVSTNRRAPNWQEMCFVKDLFWSDDECVMQLHPPKSDYVNNYSTCLHLWRPHDDAIPRPPAILVGDKATGTLDRV